MPIDKAAPFPLDPVRGQFDKFAELGRRLSALERGGTVQRGACEEDLAAIQFGQTIDWVEHTTPGLQITVPGRFGGRAVVGMHLEFEVKWVSGTAGTPQVGLRILGYGDISFGNLSLPGPGGAFVLHSYWVTRALPEGDRELRFIHWMPGGSGGVDEWRNVRMAATLVAF